MLSFDEAYRVRVTTRQAWVLENLHRVITKHKGNLVRYTIDGEDCRSQITSLGAKGIVRLNGHGQPMKIAEPEGLVEDSWSERRARGRLKLVPASG